MEFLEIDLDRKYSSITFDAPDFSVAKSGVGDFRDYHDGIANMGVGLESDSRKGFRWVG
jgi:aminopeptidase-like protein